MQSLSEFQRISNLASIRISRMVDPYQMRMIATLSSYPCANQYHIKTNEVGDYVIDGYSGTYPVLFLIPGLTYGFRLDVGENHVVFTQMNGSPVPGMLHIDTQGNVTPATRTEGYISGVLVWSVPNDARTIYYQQARDRSVGGIIAIRSFNSIDNVTAGGLRIVRTVPPY
jgi:hypothetical protein